MDKQDKTQQIAKDFETSQNRFINQMNKKKKQVENKLKQAEEQRLVDLLEKRERQRLTQIENKKRIEFQKQQLNYKKLKVLDKHTRIDEQTLKLQEGKTQFVECSRIANELRVQSMLSPNLAPGNKITKLSNKISKQTSPGKGMADK